MAIEVVLAFHLKEDTPSEIIDILEYMIDQEKRNPEDEYNPPFKLPDHPFFQKDPYKQEWLLFPFMDQGMFASIPDSSMYQYGPGDEYRVSIRTNLPSSWYQKVDDFLDWLTPYISGAGNGNEFVGYWRYSGESDPVILHV
ncbi:hypothetical protein [Laceyella putida]|uniref:Integron-associated effector binding protein domain-containing protein n=1 Tax=Laceyella putida TaxID=110101 RepID=A0ABW2RQS8_9BACL